MNWHNPLAMLGVAAVVLPVLIHMMGLGRTVVVRFPSLRFLESSRLLPARRTRIHDIGLLLLRAGTIVAAAIALAQPRFRAADVPSPAETGLVRAIVLDTSASMSRRTATGGTTLDAAIRAADTLTRGAARSVVVRTADPGAALAGAGAWASLQPGRTEVVVVSDFQRGVVDEAAVLAVPAGIGVRFERIPVGANPAGPARRTRQGGADVVARIGMNENRTDVEWTITPRAGANSLVQLRGAPASRPLLDATRRAAGAIGIPQSFDSSATGVAVVFPGSEALTALRRDTGPVANRRQATIVTRLLADPLLDAPFAGDGIATVPATASMSDATTVERTMSSTENGRPMLSIISRAPAGTTAAAILVAAAERAASSAPPVAELDPAFVADSALSVWRRAPGERPAVGAAIAAEPAQFDGRWFWLLALFLLGVETWLRRSRRPAAPAMANVDA